MFDNQCQKQLLGPKLHWHLGPGFWGFRARLPCQGQSAAVLELMLMKVRCQIRIQGLCPKKLVYP